jgi:hypothetical protein
MKLKKAFNQAIDFELTWYPERYASDQIKITKAAAKRNVRPCYDQYLDCDGDEISDCELHWYGEGGEIIASYDIERKLLTLGA